MADNDLLSTSAEPLVGAIDQGTSSSRFFIFNPTNGTVVAWHQKEIKHDCPHEGWFEADPTEILLSVQDCITHVMDQINDRKNSVRAVGIANQRETTIMWDKTSGKPLAPAIVWCDTRTMALADEFIAKTPNKNKNSFQKICGLPINPYFSALKIRWLIDNVNEIREAIENDTCLFGTVDTWLLWNLTGHHVTDVTNASRTMLMNINSQEWDQTLLDFFGIPRKILPIIKSSSEIYGNILSENLKGIPISGCLGDQSAALVGQKCFAVGQAKNTYGTGCFMLYNTGFQPYFSGHGLLTTIGYKLGPDQKTVFALEGSIAQAGDVVRWFRDNLGIIAESSEIEKLAEEVDDTGDVYFVPAFSGLYAPYWEANARGIIVGMTAYTNKNHIARAILEAVCFQTREILEAMTQDSNINLESLQVDGGMTPNNLLMQLQTDILGIPVVRPKMAEITALGAAMAAGLAVGVWGYDSSSGMRNEDRFEPVISSHERDTRYARWKKAVPRSMNWSGDSAHDNNASDSNKTIQNAIIISGSCSIGLLVGMGIMALIRALK